MFFHRFAGPAFRRFLQVVGIVSGGALLLPAATRADDAAAVDALPANIDKGLRRLVIWHRTQARLTPTAQRRTQLHRDLPAQAEYVQTNAEATSAVADVVLDGSASLDAVSASLESLGANPLARYDAGPRPGSVLSVSLSLDQVENTAHLPGVYSIRLVHRPWAHVGKATSQGAKVLHADRLNALGYDGAGITVGVISDSFDKGQNNKEYSISYATHAADDVRNGDLPGPGNPFGRRTAVHVVDAAPGDYYHNDEGRAMLQIVHDLAPGARLAFHAVGTTPETLAEAITALRTDSKLPCDVIVDDFGFSGEPYFSDGPTALAAHNAATSLLLANHPVVYVSAAGNEGDSAYAADFTPVSNSAARAGRGRGNLKLEQVPSSLTGGGFHNFNPKSDQAFTLAQRIELHGGGAEVSFQWDDPFIPGKVTSDYNLLVFDAEGNYLRDLSGTDDNFSLGNAVEVIDLPLPQGDKDVTYQFAIARKAKGTGEAKRLHYVVHGGDATIQFNTYNHQTTFGHNAGPDVIGVAAYAYDKLQHPEPFSSLGPVTIYFDQDGQRLAKPTVRQQPAVAAVDGVDTSFFPPFPLRLPDGKPYADTDGDGFPNFFGTSAAAPHVAAVAALLLQAAGGPGSLTSAQVLALLQRTASAHELDPNFVSATLSPANGAKVTLSVKADESDFASEDRNSFHLTFDGARGQYLRSLTINLAPTGLRFDPRTDDGFPFTIGSVSGFDPAQVSAQFNPADSTVTLSFPPEVFTAGKSLNFGIDRDLVSIGTAGNSADLLDGAIVKARTKGGSGGKNAHGDLASVVGSGYGPADGFGLVNAQAALNFLQAHPPADNSPKFVPGDLLLTTSDDRVIEIDRTGNVVQVIPVMDPKYPYRLGTAEHAQEAVVDHNGNLVVLSGATSPSLIVINIKTGAMTIHGGVPKWELNGNRYDTNGLGGELVPVGPYVVTVYGQADYHKPLGLLLRFDPRDGSFQAFGDRSNSPKSYVCVSTGPDGLLYALSDRRSTTHNGFPLDAYDPETLQLVRTVYLSASNGVSKFGVGLDGQIYTINDYNGSHRVTRFDSQGNQTGALSAELDAAISHKSGAMIWTNVRTDAQGNIALGSLAPVLIDPNFKTYEALDVFKSVPIPDEVSATVTFIDQ